ncbi:MAG: PAS domain S-box protein [Syntrophorhabdaceae bacterium]|nr:PAS domain S-box protein [Syntrophorhabdaceae bacterium]
MDLFSILKRYREDVVKSWVYHLHSRTGERYGAQPLEELFITVSAAYDATCAVLLHNDFSKINCHIEWIANARLLGGFTLSEVQNAYELGRTYLVPIFMRELKGKEQINAMERLNSCLLYTITKFSNYFQSLHEKAIKDYAQNLEEEVKKRTKELAESEAKYRLLIEEINDGYFVNQDGIIVFANQTFCDLHGYEAHEVIGKPYVKFVAPESLSYVNKLYNERIKRGDTQDLYVYMRLHKDGRAFPTENKVKLMLYQGREAVAGICRDITERIEMEQRMREAERLAHIGQLSTSLAHEIRNPLSSVKMNIQILLKNNPFDGNNRRRMEIMASEISRLERILEEMLDLARPLKLNLGFASINDLIDACIETMEVRFKEKEISLLKRYSKDMPYVFVDHDRMEQAIINIFLNAVEAVEHGGEIKVVTKKRRNERIEVIISDNGPGIEPDDLPYIFDPFFSKKKRGTGLGLSNVKKIIEAHGGKVMVNGGKDTGTRCVLLIPCNG